MRTIALIALLLASCAGQPDCEQLRTLIGPDGRMIFEMTCVHECGVVLPMSYWIPGPSCEWERNQCRLACSSDAQ